MHVAMHSRKSVLGRRLSFLTAQDKRCHAPDTTRDTEAIAETEGQRHRPTHKDIKHGQTVLYAHLLAQHIELMVTRSPLAKKRSVNSLPLSVSNLVILIGQALCKAFKNALVLGRLVASNPARSF